MNAEERLAEALAEFDRVEPSPDLFARLQLSLAEDIAHRRRVRRWTIAAMVGTAATAIGIVVASSVSPVNGRVVASVTAIRAIEVAVLAGLIIVLGPAIRRFGAILVADTFRSSPETGRRLLGLLDVAYYLVFSGYVLAGTALRHLGREMSLSLLLRTLLDRVAGLLLLMGILHAVTVAVLPVVGLLNASIVRRHRRALMGGAAPPPSPRAEQAERVVRLVMWLVVALLVTQLLVGVGVAIGVGLGG